MPGRGENYFWLCSGQYMRGSGTIWSVARSREGSEETGGPEDPSFARFGAFARLLLQFKLKPHCCFKSRHCTLTGIRYQLCGAAHNPTTPWFKSA
jgi:hypothetical protein